MQESMNQFTDHMFHTDMEPTAHYSTQDLLDIMDQEEEPNTNVPSKAHHMENLAEFLDPRILTGIAVDLLEAIEDDENSRSEWTSILEEAIDQLGITIEKTNLPFANATGVFSSSFMRTVLMAVANMTGELLPPTGPVKANIMGQHTDQLEDQQIRVESFMNYYLTNIAQEFYPEMEQAFMWDALYGSVFLKTYFDVTLGRPIIKYIPPQDFLVNYNASSLATCTRMTQVIMLDKKELKIQQLMGHYRNIKLDPIDQLSEAINPITEKVMGKSGIDQNTKRSSNQFMIYECHANLDLSKYERMTSVHESDENIPLPYIITIDKKSKEVLRLVRNWQEGDVLYKRKEFFTKLSFWPGFGMYSFGLAHIAGGSAKAATALQRLLIDAGILANFPGGIIDAGVQMEENNVQVGPTEFAKVRLGGQKIDEILSFIPYRDPSPVLKELKTDLEQNVLDLAAATDFKVDNLNSNVSATTTYLQLEQVNKLQNTVIQRLHRSMGEAYRLLYKQFGETLGDNQYPFKIMGNSHVIMRKDFNDSLHITPSSDSTITSSLQRIIRGQVMADYAEKFPDLHDTREIMLEIYKDMKVPQSQIDKFLPKPDESPPPPMDPISENQAQMTGKPVKAYPFQDQDAYIVTKQLLLQKPDLDPNIASAIQANIAERNAFKYRQQLEQAMGEPLPEDLSQLTPDQQNHIAQLAAQATQQLMQQMQQAAPPPLTTEMVLMEDVKVKDKAAEYKHETDLLNSENDKLKIINDLKIAELRAQTESYKTNMKHIDETQKVSAS